MDRAELWFRGMAAALISGGANGVITGIAAIGIDPTHFNLTAGFTHTLSIAGVSAAISAIIGVAAYLKQSPLPEEDNDRDWRRQHDGHDEHELHREERPEERPEERQDQRQGR